MLHLFFVLTFRPHATLNHLVQFFVPALIYTIIFVLYTQYTGHFIYTSWHAVLPDTTANKITRIIIKPNTKKKKKKHSGADESFGSLCLCFLKIQTATQGGLTWMYFRKGRHVVTIVFHYKTIRHVPFSFGAIAYCITQ